MNTKVVLSNQSSRSALLPSACPFLEHHRTEDRQCGDTILFGDIARRLQTERLSEKEPTCVFDFINELAQTGDSVSQVVLATGALETFNDDAAAQRMARLNLGGRALEMFKEMRKSWGQPDYGSEQLR